MTALAAKPLSRTFAERCPCGHDKANKLVRADCRYTLWGWLALAIAGVNVRPTEITFRCQRCMTVLEVTRDPSVLERHRAPT